MMLAVTVGALAVTTPAHSDAGITVSGIDTAGFPYVDLVVSGVPGLDLGPPPAIAVSQAGMRVPTTATWLLSASQPLAVVTDASATSLAPVQGIVGELVQSLPTALPLALVRSATGAVTPPSLNRDLFMRGLERQSASPGTQVSQGVRAAASAGIQHVFVVTTCESPTPATAPIGVIVDVIGIGPSCTDAWRAAMTGGAGRFVAAKDPAAALGALDTIVSAWRSSVVLVAQVTSRQPLQVSLGNQRTTTSMTNEEPAALGPAPAITASAASIHRSGRLVLWLGLLLLFLAVVLVVVRVVRRRRQRPRLGTYGLPADPALQQLPPLVAAALRAPPAVIDLRERADERAERTAAKQSTAPVASGAGGPADEDTKMPLMAVATPGAVRQAEHSLPATVAQREADEEPVAMAEEQVPDGVKDEAPQDEQHEVHDEPADVQDAAQDSAQDVEQDAEETPAEETPAEETPADETPADEPAEEPAEAMADEPAEAMAEQPAEAMADEVALPHELPPTEFNWTPLQFSPLKWRYDAEPEGAAAIDLRDSAVVDVREKAGSRPSRNRRKPKR